VRRKPAAPGGNIKGYVNIEASLANGLKYSIREIRQLFPVVAALCVGSAFSALFIRR
jgi:hypothetical protein